MGRLNTGYRLDLEKLKITEEIKILASSQLELFSEHFEDNQSSIRTTFELFAQGLLFDNEVNEDGIPRRRPGTKIHMMDSSITGFIVWHAFIRAVLVLNHDNQAERWLQLDRYIGLAAAILSTLINEGRAPQQSLTQILINH
jgi:hypothetical protein